MAIINTKLQYNKSHPGLRDIKIKKERQTLSRMISNKFSIQIPWACLVGLSHHTALLIYCAAVTFIFREVVQECLCSEWIDSVKKKTPHQLLYSIEKGSQWSPSKRYAATVAKVTERTDNSFKKRTFARFSPTNFFNIGCPGSWYTITGKPNRVYWKWHCILSFLCSRCEAMLVP